LQLRERLRERLDALAQRHNVPGVAVGVDVAGESWFETRGVTHVAHPLAVDEHTLFQIASNTKPFTATLALQLVGEGRIGLDDPVGKVLPELVTPDPQQDAAITLRNLLSHRVGWDGDALFVRQPSPPRLDNLFDVLSGARQLVPPGSAFTYSNAAFSVAGRIVEVLREKPFAAVLRERILEPLGMQRTCTRADEAIFHRVAMRHLALPGREPIPLAGGGWQRGWELAPVDTPAGGILSSASDLLRWLRFWLGRPEPGATPPLDDALRARMCEDQLPPWNPQSGQAIGWAVRRDPAARVLSHGGVTAGYCSFTLFAPALDLAAVVLTNATSGSLLHVELTRWLVGEVGGRAWEDPPALAVPPELAPYAGRYWGAFGVTTVGARAGELELTTLRHSTDDGSWQPPAEPSLRARLCSPKLAIAVAPEASRGALIDFDPSTHPPRWLRVGSRISVRE
jgi:CubicO group peptidase (beta-lactamase class C family)